MIARLIGGLVAILIASLIPSIAKQVQTASANTTSSWGGTVLKLVPGFFALALLGIGIAIAYGALRSAGLVGDRGGLEERTSRYNCTGNVTNDLYGSMNEEQALAEVRKATEPPKYYKDSQLRTRDTQYQHRNFEEETKYDYN